MKKYLCLIVVGVILLSTLSVYALPYGSEWENYSHNAGIVYSDVPRNHWAYDAILRSTEKNWFSGYPDGTFRPNGSITRAEALKVFVVFLGLDYKSVDLSSTSFYDVDADEWYAPYIEAGKELFPTHTTIQGKTPFNPNMPVTREDTIYALVKALGCDVDAKYPDQSVLNMFVDKSSISGGLKEYFTIALEHELVSGFPDGTIRAQDALTRAEFSTLLLRGTEHGFHDNYVAKISMVTVSPASSVELEIGENVSLSARATYTDGTNRQYSELQPYIVDNNGVIALSGTSVVALKEGNATIMYNDSYLKGKSLSVTVKKPTDAPKIKILSYPDITEEETVEISGTVTDKTETEIDLKCNTKDILLSGESFSYTALLTDGVNNFEFVAVNGYGNSTSKIISITKNKKQPTSVVMVNLVGKKEAEAKSIVEGLGLKVNIETVWDENVAEGLVVEQSIESGETVELGKTITITVSGGQNDWVGWLDSLPTYVNGNNYIIEEKNQYRYMKKETTSGNSSVKNGWTLEREEESFGSWSEWSRNSVIASPSREVRTKDVADPQQYKTQWHYTRYYGWNSSKGVNVSWPWKGTYSNTYQESGWRDAPLENRGRADAVDATCYKDPSDPISIWWWNETTRSVALPMTYHKEYQYRDKSITYYFYRWGDWSQWQDTVMMENDTTKVETKIVYRYKFK